MFNGDSSFRDVKRDRTLEAFHNTSSCVSTPIFLSSFAF